MSVTAEKTVRELAAANPSAPRVFESLGIDYCCGGEATLQAACAAANLNPDEVLGALKNAAAGAGAAPSGRNWLVEPLAALTGHIESTHHRYVRQEIERLGPLFDKVIAAHGVNHPELKSLRSTFAGLADELTAHLMKEEMVLFPYIVRMEESVLAGKGMPPAPFGTVRNPVQMMMNEHDGAGDALRVLHRDSQGYTAPGDACMSFRELYLALAGFERDLHQHIHLENNILFPRAIAMEASGR